MAARPRPTTWLSLLVLTTVTIFLTLPLIAFLLNAFARSWFYPQLIPQNWTLEAWVRAFSPQSDVLQALGNSILIAGVVTPTALLIGLPAGRALGLYTFRGQRLIEFLLLLPAIVPPLAVSMGLTVNFLRWGLAGNWIGVSLAHLVPVLPYTILIFSGMFNQYSLEHEQQARALGAKPWSVVCYVTLPLIKPGIIIAGLFAFLISWSQYLLTLLIGSGRVVTLPILLFSSAAGGNNMTIAAQALLFTAPALLLLLVTSRLLSANTVSGLGRL
ncbi:MAG: ABC transporter permease subunit [Anaerolineae bacterium]|nr:ABC transporter permease subunit [Anaerolineae bacterium]